MDGQRFDQIVRAFARPRRGSSADVVKGAISRRGVVIGTAAALGGLVGSRDVEAATCRGNGRSCRGAASCCSGHCGIGPRGRSICTNSPICRSNVGQCFPLGESCLEFPCCSGVCQQGTCRCVELNGVCADQYDCCPGLACTEGSCLPVAAGNACASNSDCGNGTGCFGGVCSACDSGEATIPPYTTDDDDCPWSMPGYACGNNAQTGALGFAYCCIPGENCEGDPCARRCSGVSAQAGQAYCNGI